MRKRASLLAVIGMTAVASLGCENADTNGGGLIPMPITGTPVTETFTGTVVVAGSDIHSFVVNVSGTVNVTLTAAGPPATIPMGLGVGSPTTSNGSLACSLLTGATTSTPAGTTPQLSGTLTAGPYCVAVFDNGSGVQTAPVTYTVTVFHT